MTEEQLFPIYETKGVKSIYNDGVGIPTDETEEAGHSYMLSVGKTTKREFSAYLSKLRKLGFKKEEANETANITAAGWYRDGVRIYTYYSKATKTARVIRDESSVAIDEFSCPECVGDSRVTYYQFGVPMAPDGSDIKVNGKRINCGQIYFIRLSDNSIFLIDGSEKQSFGDDTMEECYRLMCELCGSEDIVIRCFYITHGHNDHFYGFLRMLGRYGDHIKVERLAFNFPTLTTEEVFKSCATPRINLGKYIMKYCPDAKFLKPHTAQSFTIGDVRCDVIYTHEDIIDPETGLSGLRDFNNTSVVLKLSFGGRTLMQLGDINNSAEKVILKNMTKDELKADAVQVAHHTWNAVLDLYDAIDAETALFPQTSGGAVKDDKRREISAKILSHAKRAYYAGDETTGLVAAEEGIVAVDHRAIVGGDYTGWSL